MTTFNTLSSYNQFELSEKDWNNLKNLSDNLSEKDQPREVIVYKDKERILRLTPFKWVGDELFYYDSIVAPGLRAEDLSSGASSFSNIIQYILFRIGQFPSDGHLSAEEFGFVHFDYKALQATNILNSGLIFSEIPTQYPALGNTSRVYGNLCVQGERGSIMVTGTPCPPRWTEHNDLRISKEILAGEIFRAFANDNPTTIKKLVSATNIKIKKISVSNQAEETKPIKKIKQSSRNRKKK